MNIRVPGTPRLSIGWLRGALLAWSAFPLGCTEPLVERSPGAPIETVDSGEFPEAGAVDASAIRDGGAQGRAEAGPPSTPDATSAPVDAGSASRLDAAVGADEAGAFDASDAALWVSPPGGEIVGALPDPESGEPFFLSRTGLYVDIAAKVLSGDVLRFAPRHPLWSDGATKDRFLRLPKGETIDTSDMSSWRFPVGTMLFKEFTRDGVRIETRLIARTGEGERDYWMGAFVWSSDESDARFAPEGAEDARGTQHDVPSTTQCGTCHNGELGRVLGVSAIQLALASPLGVGDLGRMGWLSVPAEDEGLLTAPGDEGTAAALGYLHGNCGHCHNPRGSARPDTDLHLRLTAGERDPTSTPAHESTVGIPLQNFMDATLTTRVVAGDPEASALWFRMGERGMRTQMPPLATEEVDADGVDLVRQWIERL